MAHAVDRRAQLADVAVSDTNAVIELAVDESAEPRPSRRSSRSCA